MKSRLTVLKWIHSGELVASNFGGRAGYRIAEEDIDAFVKAKVVNAGKKKHAQ